MGFIGERLWEIRSNVSLKAGDLILEAEALLFVRANKAQGKKGGTLEPALVERGGPRRRFEKERRFVQFAALELFQSVRHVLPGDKLH
jgi:hypothetical protein